MMVAQVTQILSSAALLIDVMKPRIGAADEVGPGGGRNYLGYLGDHHGNTLRETLSRGLTNASAIVQVVTWNDFGEGSMVEPTRQYGYRDLGILQDLRRQYLESDFPRHTNDLALALRFYELRRQSATNQVLSAELDGIFTNIVSGQIASASLQLDRLKP